MYWLSASLLALVPYVLGTPSAVSLAQRSPSSGCTQRSLQGFEWNVDGFDFHSRYIFSTPAHQNSHGYVNFNLSNSAMPDVHLSCSAVSTQLQEFFYGSMWYQCTTDGKSYGPAPASFTFNRPMGELDINQTWKCDDQNPRYPWVFHFIYTVMLLVPTDAYLVQPSLPMAEPT